WQARRGARGALCRRDAGADPGGRAADRLRDRRRLARGSRRQVRPAGARGDRAHGEGAAGAAAPGGIADRRAAGPAAADGRRRRRRQDPDALGLLEQVKNWVQEARRIVALTGAGISTDSGIPDFRGPQGVWTKNPVAEKMSNIHYYLADAEVRKASWQNRLSSPAWRAKPNPGHLALVELERQRKLHALITQNIDELHQLAGNSAELVIEVHGSMRRFMCWGCGMRG